MECEALVKKKNRQKKQQKKRFAKTSSTFSDQVARSKTNRGYSGRKGGAKVVVKI